MTIEMLKGKIHRATVIQAELDYVGSITVDEELLEAAGILEYEKVQIVDVNNGSRFETYTIRGKILNVEKASIDKVLANAEIKTMINAFGCGFSEGYGNDFDITKLRYDKIIIMAYGQYSSEEAASHKPAVVFVDEKNQISRVTNYERHGLLKDMDT